MKVVFGFSKPKHETILSKGIRSIEKRPYSHAYLRLPDPYSGQELVFQASALQINACLYEVFIQTCQPVKEYELVVPEMRKLELWQFLLRRLGLPYSMVQLWWIFVKKITGRRLGSNNERQQICSEFAARVGQFLEMRLPRDDFDYETPSSWEKVCASQLRRIL